MKSCKYEIVGMVKEMNDINGFSFYIEGKDKKIYHPLIEQENIVISSGARVRICYDSVSTLADNSLQIRINDVVYLP